MIEQRSGRPQVGAQVNVEGIGLCEVLDSADPSLITLKRSGGATLKIGHRALADRLARENRPEKKGNTQC